MKPPAPWGLSGFSFAAPRIPSVARELGSPMTLHWVFCGLSGLNIEPSNLVPTH